MFENIKIIFIDIDGTLINSKKILSERTKKIITKLSNAGILVVLASGRQAIEVEIMSLKAGSGKYIIASNGAIIKDWKNNEILSQDCIEKHVVNELFEYATKRNINVLLNCDRDRIVDKNYFDNPSREIDNLKIYSQCNLYNVDQIVFLSRNKASMQEMESNLKNYKKLYISSKTPEKHLKDGEFNKYYYLDVTNQGVAKGKAIIDLCGLLNISLDNTMAIGNDLNDLSMFEVVKHKVAVKNAASALKKESTYITDTNNNDGVAKVLEKVYNDCRR